MTILTFTTSRAEAKIVPSESKFTIASSGISRFRKATFERNYIAGVRQGVEIEYIPNIASA